MVAVFPYSVPHNYLLSSVCLLHPLTLSWSDQPNYIVIMLDYAEVFIPITIATVIIIVVIIIQYVELYIVIASLMIEKHSA